MRDIHELIWHCTATPEGRPVTVAEIDAWHKSRGWNGIGYHKVVYLDGTVHDGRPIDQIGAHVEGHNTGTIGYVYVGGTDSKGVPKDTRTLAQKTTMLRLTKEAINQFHLRKVTGHREYAAKACPCFDAYAEYNGLITGNVVDDTTSLSAAHGSDPRLQWLQKLLIQLNYSIGMADGIMGPSTQAGVMKFQADNKLPISGMLDTTTVAVLKQKAENKDRVSVATTTVTKKDDTITVTTKPAVTATKLAAITALTAGVSLWSGSHLAPFIRSFFP